MKRRDLEFRYRCAGELSEFQRRIGGLPRKALLHLNNATIR